MAQPQSSRVKTTVLKRITMSVHHKIATKNLLTIYLSGPMSGIPDFNYPAFNAEAAKLRAEGHRVINPAESDLPASAAWRDHMREDLRHLLGCTQIHLLPGHSQSKGAMLELSVAHALGMKITMARP